MNGLIMRLVAKIKRRNPKNSSFHCSCCGTYLFLFFIFCFIKLILFFYSTIVFNFLRIGFIKAILPNARIIHLTRDPMDNCLSIFKNLLAPAYNYSYDLAELGHYYKLYLALMEHWRGTLSGLVYDQSYEQLVADPETQISKLLDYCNLPWHDACLDFHSTRRKVKTSSNAQVRRPIYQNSVELWKRYQQQLEPLRVAIYD